MVLTQGLPRADSLSLSGCEPEERLLAESPICEGFQADSKREIYTIASLI